MNHRSYPFSAIPFFLWGSLLSSLVSCVEVPSVSQLIGSPKYGIACEDHASCESGICFPGFQVAPGPPKVNPHTCIPTELVKYVDYNLCDPTKQDSAHQGTKQDPFCQLTTALSKGSFIVVKPAREPNGYAGVTLQKGQGVVIVGAGRTSGTVVRGIYVQDLGTEAYLDGLTLSTKTQRSSMPAGLGLSCAGSAIVTLVRSVVSENTQGISATQCKHLQVERSYIGNNGNAGIVLTEGSSYSILNSLIVQNGGVGIIVGSKGLINFTTLSQNGMDAQIPEAQDGGGLLCLQGADPSGTEPISVQNTILVGNQMNLGSATPTQIQGASCKLKQVVVSPRDALSSIHPTSQGVSRAEVSFLKHGTEWKLDLGSRSWDKSLVIDRAKVEISDAITQDYFGTPRPRPITQRTPGGTGFDIGHEQATP